MKPRELSAALILLAVFIGLGAAGERGDIDQAEMFFKRQDWASARRAYQVIVSSNPYNGKYWARLGEACSYLKDYEAATQAFKKQLETGYELGSGIFAIARGHALLNEPQEAVSWLRKLIPLRYGSELQSLLQFRRGDFKNIENDSEFVKLLTPQPGPGSSRVEGWRLDLKLLAEHLVTEHYDVFNKVSQAEFEASVRALNDIIPELPDHQVIAEMMKIAAAVGDGHTSLFPPDKGKHAFHQIPVMFYLFKEGLCVRAAEARYKTAVGKRVIRIGYRTAQEAYDLAKTISPADNDMTFRRTVPLYLTLTEVLYNLDLTDDLGRVGLVLEDDAGRPFHCTFEAVPADLSKRRDKVEDEGWVSARDGASLPLPLWLKNPGDQYWFEYLPQKKMVYFQFNQILNKGTKIPEMPELDDLFKAPDGSTETVAEFCRRLFEFIRTHEVDFLVVDLRLNNGGNSFLNQALVHELIKSEKINQRGRLFTIIGRRTFSACQNLTTDLERETQTILVGEPSGSKPNFIGEDNHFSLPFSGLTGSVSTRYHQHSILSDDHRNWVAPEIAAELSLRDFKANIDPAMDAILEYIERKGKGPAGK